MLLRRQHQNGKHQQRSQEHLNKQPLRHTNTGRQQGLHDAHIPRKHGLHQRGGDHPQNLGGDQEHPPRPRQRAGHHQSQHDGRVEQSAADAVETPGGDGEGEAEGERDKEDGGGGGEAVRVAVRGGGDLRGGEREPEEEDRADEFARGSHQVGADVFPAAALGFWVEGGGLVLELMVRGGTLDAVVPGSLVVVVVIIIAGTGEEGGEETVLDARVGVVVAARVVTRVLGAVVLVRRWVIC